MHPLLRLFRDAKDHRSQIWFASTFTIINKLCDLAPAFLIGVAVDIVVAQEDSFIARLGVSASISQLGILSVLTLLVWGLERWQQWDVPFG